MLRKTWSVPYYSHQLPKGLHVDEAVLLGKDKDSEAEEQQNEKLMQE